MHVGLHGVLSICAAVTSLFPQGATARFCRGQCFWLGPAGTSSLRVAALRPYGTGPAGPARLQSSSRYTCSSRGGRKAAHPLAARLIPNPTPGARARLQARQHDWRWCGASAQVQRVCSSLAPVKKLTLTRGLPRSAQEFPQFIPINSHTVPAAAQRVAIEIHQRSNGTVRRATRAATTKLANTRKLNSANAVTSSPYPSFSWRKH